MNGRVDDGFLIIPGRGAINFASGEEALVNVFIAVTLADRGEQEPKTFIFLHTWGSEVQTEKEATWQGFDDISEWIEGVGFKERLYYIDGNIFNFESMSFVYGLGSAQLRLASLRSAPLRY